MATNFETLRSLAAGSVSGSAFAPIGTPLTYPSRAFRILNDTNEDVEISNDGVNAKWFLPSGTSVVWDIQTNSAGGRQDPIPANTQFGAMYPGMSAPTTGSVYIESQYSTIPGF